MRGALLAGLCALLSGCSVPAKAATCDAVWTDAARGREVPVRIRMPDGGGAVPLVIYSPGLGGMTATGNAWSTAWVARGIAVIHMQHKGSDAAIYTDPGTPEERRARRDAAASAAQLVARVADVGFVLDEVAQRRRVGACDLSRIDLGHIGIAGHSMGAWTAQAVAGQRFDGAAQFRDRRIIAAIAMSPAVLTNAGLAESFGGITIPFLSITGSEDGVPAKATPEQRAAAAFQHGGPYAGMPPGGKYLLVIKDADHMVFTGGRRVTTGPGGAAAEPGAENASPTVVVPVAHVNELVTQATTAFWGATLLGDARDAAFLRSDAGLAARLAPGDRFERK
jgi:predicted dienelactone hydrolase